MIVEPDRYVEEFADAGADIITVHAEATMHLDRTVQLVKKTGKKCGVSLNPHTSLDVLNYVLDKVDMVLLMSVNPGFGAQSFIPYSIRKAQELKNMIDSRGHSIDIEMDGGIDENNVREIVKAGVNVIVSGNTIFKAEDPKNMISRLKLEK
jgi:ribulose-phosphate 3-epimerase